MSIIGIPIGIYGYLFPGNINLMVLDLYISKRYKILVAVLALIVIFESFYCLFTLLLLGGLEKSNNWYQSIQLGSFILIMVMGIWMISERKGRQQSVQQNTLNRGIISVVVHPQQIPFWLIIGVVVNPLMKFEMDRLGLIGFVVCNAIGTLITMSIYMVFGSRVLHYFKLNISNVNKILGLIYVAVGGYSLALFYFGK